MRNRVGELDAACLTDAESRSKQRCCGSKGVDVVNVHQKTCASTEVASGVQDMVQRVMWRG
jgi:hypothetical protein